MNNKVIGIDPATFKLGIAILEPIDPHIKLIESTQLYLEDKTLEARLNFLYNWLDNYLSINQVSAIALEETFVAPFDDKSGKYKFNLDAPLKLSMSRGIIWAIAGKYNIKVYEYSNGDVKRTVTRNHQASKKMIIDQISKTFGRKFAEDEADSVAIGITHLITKRLQNKK